MTKKKAIIFSSWLEAPDELNEFCKSIGYDEIDYHDFKIMFDERIIEFCEKRLSRLWYEKVYKGKESYDFRCGFVDAGYIREIDTSKKWKIKYNHVDVPIIDCIDIKTNQYGYTSIIFT